MNRGTVMESGNNKAVVLTPDGQFVRIKVRRDVAIGDEISWTTQDAVSDWGRSVLHRPRWMSFAVSAAAVLLLMLGLWSFWTPPVVAYVSMDVNPSVEFGLDSHERVRELRAVNRDAAPLIEGVGYKGKSIESVMEILAKKLTDSHILNGGDGEIVIASVRLRSVDTKWEVRVTDKIERVLQQANAGSGDKASLSSVLDIEKLFLPVEVRDEAKANGISSGKMAFWLAAESKGHEVALSSLQQNSLKKIASSWGGVKRILDDSQEHKEDENKWKKLLASQKQRNKQHKEMKPSPTPAQPVQSEKPVSLEGNSESHRKDHPVQQGHDMPDSHGKQRSKDDQQDKQKEKQSDNHRKDGNSNHQGNPDYGNHNRDGSGSHSGDQQGKDGELQKHQEGQDDPQGEPSSGHEHRETGGDH
jgi:hypothetical protein